MEERAVGARFDIVDSARLEVDVEGAGNVLARTGLGEEGGEATIAVGARTLRGTTIGLESDECEE